MPNPMKMLKNIDFGAIKELKEVLESMHEYLEKIETNTKKCEEHLAVIKESSKNGQD